MKRLLNLFLIVAGIFLFTSCLKETEKIEIPKQDANFVSMDYAYVRQGNHLLRIDYSFENLSIDTLWKDSKGEFTTSVGEKITYYGDGHHLVGYAEIKEIDGERLDDFNNRIADQIKLKKFGWRFAFILCMVIGTGLVFLIKKK